jgi:hypothetical protein
MANECSNYITITGPKILIDEIAENYIGYDPKEDVVNFSFEVMCPIPTDLEEDDYYWRIENWGNKWDGVYDSYVEIDEDEITISVSTAWSPCDKWTYKLISLCPGVEIYHEYFEPGEGYIGSITHHCDEGPDDYSEEFYNNSHQPFEYWVMTFEKEYENFDWLLEYIDELKDEEEITEEQYCELLELINGGSPLETIVQKCLDYEVL